MKVKRNGTYQRSSSSNKNCMDNLKKNEQHESCHADTPNLNHVWTNKSQWHQRNWHKTMRKHRFPPVKFASRVNNLWKTLMPLRVCCSCSSTSDNEDVFRSMNKFNKKSTSSVSMNESPAELKVLPVHNSVLSDKTEGKMEKNCMEAVSMNTLSDISQSFHCHWSTGRITKRELLQDFYKIAAKTNSSMQRKCSAVESLSSPVTNIIEIPVDIVIKESARVIDSERLMDYLQEGSILSDLSKRVELSESELLLCSTCSDNRLKEDKFVQLLRCVHLEKQRCFQDNLKQKTLRRPKPSTQFSNYKEQSSHHLLIPNSDCNEDKFHLRSKIPIKRLCSKGDYEEDASSGQSYITASTSDFDKVKIKCLYSARDSRSSVSSLSSSMSKSSEKIIKSNNESLKEYNEDFIFVNTHYSNPSSCVLYSLDVGSNSLLQKTDQIYDTSFVSSSHNTMKLSDSTGSSTLISFYVNQGNTARLSNKKFLSKKCIGSNYMPVPKVTSRNLHSTVVQKRNMNLKTLDPEMAHISCSGKPVEVVFKRKQQRIRGKRSSSLQKMHGDSNKETKQFNMYKSKRVSYNRSSLSSENLQLHHARVKRSLIFPFKTSSKSKMDLEEKVMVIRPIFISKIPMRTLNANKNNWQKSDKIVASNELDCKSSARIVQYRNSNMFSAANNHELPQSQPIQIERYKIFNSNARPDLNQNYTNSYNYESNITLNSSNNKRDSCEIIMSTYKSDALYRASNCINWATSNTVDLQSKSETPSLRTLHFPNKLCSNIFCKSSTHENSSNRAFNLESNTRTDCRAKLYLETNIKLNSGSDVEFVKGVFRLKKSFSMIQIKPHDFTYKTSAKDNKSRCSINCSNYTPTYHSTRCENKDVVQESTIFSKKFISSHEDVNSTTKMIHVESDTQHLEPRHFSYLEAKRMVDSEMHTDSNFDILEKSIPYVSVSTNNQQCSNEDSEKSVKNVTRDLDLDISKESEHRKDGQSLREEEQFGIPFKTEALLPDQRIRTIRNMDINMSKEKRISFTNDILAYANDLNPVTSTHLSNFIPKCNDSNINNLGLEINNVNTALSSDVQEPMNALSSLKGIKKISTQRKVFDRRAKAIAPENNINDFTTKDTGDSNVSSFIEINTFTNGDNESEFKRSNYRRDTDDEELRTIVLNDYLNNSYPTKTFTTIKTPANDNCKSNLHSSKCNKSAERSLKKFCPICNRQRKQSPRYVLPICTVKGATPFPRNENDPWIRVLEKVTVKQNPQHKLSTAEEHLQCTRSTSCHYSASQHFAEGSKALEINVKKQKEDIKITIVELHGTSSSSSINPTGNMDLPIVSNERSTCALQSPLCPSSSFNFSTSYVPRTRSPRRYRKKQSIASATCMANRLLYVISESAELSRSISPFLPETTPDWFPYETLAKRSKRAHFN